MFNKLSIITIILFMILLVVLVIPLTLIRITGGIVLSSLLFISLIYFYFRNRKLMINSKHFAEDRDHKIHEIESELDEITAVVFNKIESIPVFITQLESVIEETENAANSLITNFIDIKSELKTLGIINNDTIAKKVSDIVISVQFQDITRQKIEHVIEPLNIFYNEIVNKIDTLKIVKKQFITLEKEETEEWLMKFYTMESERENLRKAL